MNKQEFFENLKRELHGHSQEEVAEIIRDQEEYVNDAIAAGRREEDVLRSLGSPAAFASNLRAESRIQRAGEATTLPGQVSNTFGAVLAVLALAPLNFIFVLGPFLMMVGFLFTGWVMGFAGFAAAFALFGFFFAQLIIIPAGLWTHLSALFFHLGTVSGSLLFLLLMLVVTKGFLTLTIGYLRWNIKFIQGAAR